MSLQATKEEAAVAKMASHAWSPVSTLFHNDCWIDNLATSASSFRTNAIKNQQPAMPGYWP